MMNIWGMTDIGLVRRENQDAYAVLQEQMEKEIEERKKAEEAAG